MRVSSVAAASTHGILDLRVGELVEVKSEDEILRTLDARGTLDGLPFMPEMLEFCGKRFRVYKRAHKACDTVTWGTLRRMENAVHLGDLRCNGAAHDGCQAGCLIYWKEAWLRRVSGPRFAPAPDTSEGWQGTDRHADPSVCTRDTLMRSTRIDEAGSDEEIFSCQATELLRATISPIPWWQPAQYISDVRSGNASVRSVVRGLIVGFFNKFQQANARLHPRLRLVHGGRRYPFLDGKARPESAAETLDLQPGDLVEVKSKEEIFQTLDESDKTRGLRFDAEMLKYCGRRGRVLRKVERIIDENSGRMIRINSDCFIVNGFICTGDYHRSCPRSIYPYWREAWLRRVSDVGGAR